jgi:hypothetical protein
MANFVNENRIGGFYIENKIINDHPEQVLALLRNMLIISAESELRSRTIHYLAYSPLFDPVPSDRSIDTPVYTLVAETELRIKQIKVKQQPLVRKTAQTRQVIIRQEEKEEEDIPVVREDLDQSNISDLF